MKHLAAVAALLAMLAGATPVVCAGWEPTPQGRMDCCERMQHDCADQMAADSCCSRGEESQPRQSSAGAFMLAMPAPILALDVSIAANLAALQSAAQWYQLTLDARPQRPPHLLTSALLI